MDIGNPQEVITTAAYLYEQAALLTLGLALGQFFKFALICLSDKFADDSPLNFDMLAEQADSLASQLGQLQGADSTILAAFILLRGVPILAHSPYRDIRAVNASRTLASGASFFRTAPSGPGFVEVAIAVRFMTSAVPGNTDIQTVSYPCCMLNIGFDTRSRSAQYGLPVGMADPSRYAG